MSKLQELTETTDVQDSDLLYVVRDPDGSPADRKVTAANARKTPAGVLFVDGRYTGNVTPYFDNISDALTAANALIAGGLSAVTIRAFLDTNGSPIGLGDNDYYTLRDSGITFESSYDPIYQIWRGGSIDVETLLYDVDINELTIDINL